MNADLRERLRRLGVHKGAANLKPSRPALEAHVRGNAANDIAGDAPTPAASLQPIRTPYGYAYVHRAEYALAHQHGDRALNMALQCSADAVAQLLARRSASIDLSDVLFLDTETTGLAGGAGTLVFLVGLGYFDADHFVVEQFFLRDPAEEAAMLCEIDRRVNRRAGLVTFNGQSFDVPLLESRFILSRIAPSFADKAHLDLLLPARRVWRGSLDSCSLGSLEFHMLGVQREQRDVPGSVIPYLYREYLAQRQEVQRQSQTESGDLTDDMQRVMYHNLLDILSMVTLTSRLVDVLLQPRDAAEQFAAARFYERAGEYATAERGYRSAAEAGANGTPHSEALRRLARLLKKQRRIAEALPYWQQLCDADDVEALIEAAKYYEWREVDLPRALAQAQNALRLSSDSVTRAALSHRVERLQRKLSAGSA